MVQSPVSSSKRSKMKEKKKIDEVRATLENSQGLNSWSKG